MLADHASRVHSELAVCLQITLPLFILNLPFPDHAPRVHPELVVCLQITLPMFILNAIDDPLVPEIMHDIPKQFACKYSRYHVVTCACRDSGSHISFPNLVTTYYNLLLLFRSSVRAFLKRLVETCCVSTAIIRCVLSILSERAVVQYLLIAVFSASCQSVL